MLVFGHRGASGYAPENTLTAIQIALDMDVDGIEVDVFEVEGELVVIHDRWLQRTTSGEGHIQKQSFEYIRSLDAGDGQQIPTLEEVISTVKGQCTLNIELKGIFTLEPLFLLLNKAQAHYNFDVEQLLISSFNHRLLSIIHQLQPQYRIGALTASYPLEYAKFATQLNAYSVHISVDFVSEHFVDDAHNCGLKVFVYTVDEESDIDEMKAYGVDGIFSNYPTKAKARIAHT
jgi:glycerophosphoryl diester phosphodiesterase